MTTELWNKISFTKDYDKATSTWTGKLRNSLNPLNDADGRFLEQHILAQVGGGEDFEVDEQEYVRYLRHKVRRPEGEVTVSVPQDTEVEAAVQPHEVREFYSDSSLVGRHWRTDGPKNLDTEK